MDENTELEIGKVDEEQENKSENLPEENKNNHKIFDDILEIIESTVVTMFVIMLVFTFFLHPVNVVGDSMNPTLVNEDRIFMSTVYTSLDYGDIVIINNDYAYGLDSDGNAVQMNIDGSQLKECIIKRIIAGEGQTVDIKDGKLSVDGKFLDEPYIASGAKTNALDAFSGSYPITIPEGYYFVMGDNREHSSDSRDSRVGLIKKDQIYGKAIIRYAPFSEFRLLGNTVNESSDER